jgi:DNA-binding MarR family transcriptional regulator
MPTHALFPTRDATLRRMVEKDWLERRRDGLTILYRIRPAGRAAYSAKLPEKPVRQAI